MSVYYSLDNLPEKLRHSVVTIGNFDGVHRGHQALLEHVGRIKGSRRGGVLSFSPHPLEILNPEKKLFCLSSDAQKAQLLLSFGIDFVILHKLRPQFLQLSPQNFISEVLEHKLALQELVIGDDFSFGAKASGNSADLRERAFKLHVIAGLTVKGERCSSSRIRNYLSLGELDRARDLLGRPFSMIGRVEKGQGLARKLGFNTANIKAPPHFGLKRGVYASITRIGNKDYISATNVGFRPSVSTQSLLVIESHCIDQKLELNNAEIEIIFLEYIREEQKFTSIFELQKQIFEDINYIRYKYKTA